MAMTNEEIKYYENMHSIATKDFEKISAVCEEIIACRPYQWTPEYMLTLNCVGIVFFKHKSEPNELTDIIEKLNALSLNYEYVYSCSAGGIKVEYKENPLLKKFVA